MLARPEFGTRQHILAWLATKRPSTTFDWTDTTKCAVAQYCKAYGQPNVFFDSLSRFDEFPDLNMVDAVAGELSPPLLGARVAFGDLKAELEREWGATWSNRTR